MAKIALAVHGGAGTILRSLMTPELEAEYRGGLEDGLRAGWDVLQQGGSSLDAVEAAVVSLEDFPLFNAGRGSVFTHEGKNEMDAAIMDGHMLDAGSVAFVKNVNEVGHTYNIYTISADGSNERKLTSGDFNHSPQFVGNTSIIYSSSNYNWSGIYKINLDGSNRNKHAEYLDHCVFVRLHKPPL